MHTEKIRSKAMQIYTFTAEWLRRGWRGTADFFSDRFGKHFVGRLRPRTGPSAERDALGTSLVELAVESWRFAKVFERMAESFQEPEKGRHVARLRWFLKRTEETLDASGMRIVNVEGHPYDPGIAATPLNIEEFGPDEVLVVEQMLEPIVMNGERLIRTGTVLLRRENR